MSSPNRNLHSRIDIGRLCKLVKGRLRSHRGRDWNAAADGVYELREWLLVSQRHRCAYCQITISSTEVGICELDHVLPKLPSSQLDTQLARLNDIQHRYHTLGYSAFTYSVGNIVLVCKYCNSAKSSFDPLADRSTYPQKLPKKGKDYRWVHPQLHKYEAHIEIDEDWIYTGRTKNGRTLITTCKMDKGEFVRRRRQADALHSQALNIEDYLIKYGAQCENISKSQGVSTLTTRYGLSKHKAERVVDIWLGYARKKGIDTFGRALEASFFVINERHS